MAHVLDNVNAITRLFINVENQIADGVTVTQEGVQRRSDRDGIGQRGGLYVEPFLDNLRIHLGVRPVRTVGQRAQRGQFVLSNPTVDEAAYRSDRRDSPSGKGSTRKSVTSAQKSCPLLAGIYSRRAAISIARALEK